MSSSRRSRAVCRALVLPLAFAALMPGAHALSAQSVTMSEVSGVVTGPAGEPVVQALVNFTPIGPGTTYDRTSGPLGGFDFGLIQPGSYEIRVEALGYRPLVARVLTVGGGEQRTLRLALNAAAPPVLTVDTLTLGAAASTRFRSGDLQLSGWAFDQLPHRFDDLASVTSLSTNFDRALGSQGLPTDLSLIYADGVPFYRAPHPVARSEVLPDALFPVSALSGLSPRHNAADVEWTGAPGGYVTLATRTPASTDGLEVNGSYAGDPTWSSSELDFEKPSLLSYQAGIAGAVEITPGRSQVAVSGEALRQQTPLAPRVSEDVAGQLIGLGEETVSDLSGPGVETYERYSGVARFDLLQGRDNQFWARGAASFSSRTFEGAGPVSLAGAAAPADESIDYSFAAGLINQYSSSAQAEIRIGYSGSSRDFRQAIPDRLPGFLNDSGYSIGEVPSATGESSRTDFIVIPSLRYELGPNETIKGGATVRISDHKLVDSPFQLDDLIFAEPLQLAAGIGVAQQTFVQESSFGTKDIGAFAQYDIVPTPGLKISLGARYDYEKIDDRPALNGNWEAATGLDNTDYPDTFHQVGMRGAVTWDRNGSGNTVTFLSGSMHYGDVDPRAIGQSLSQAVGASSARYAGPEVTWPTGGAPSGGLQRSMVTILGPDTRPPRSLHLSAGVIQRLTPTIALFLRGSLRRTDFLLRRRNLNVAPGGTVRDPYTRVVHGDLLKNSGVVVTLDPDARQFRQFAEVSALDPDGWSKYSGVTAGLEHNGTLVDVYASYTLSETLDNWVGAAGGSVGGELPPGLANDDLWSEGTSDFDVRHRVTAGLTGHIGPVMIGGVYRFRSGLPFTPGYRLGVDANGDGSMRNDVAFVPSGAALEPLLDEWSCLEAQAGSFATRNGCRGASEHSVDARVQLQLGSISGRTLRLTVDAFNLIEPQGGIMDKALLLVDPDRSISVSPDGSVVTVPTVVNPGFGEILYPSSRGRMLRVGVRFGG